MPPNAEPIGIYNSNQVIPGLIADAYLNETHTSSNQVAVVPLQDGALVTDHIISMPDMLEMQLEVSNTDPDRQDSGGFVRRGEKAKTAWDFLETAKRDRTKLRITTLHKTYIDMVIVDLTGVHAAPFVEKMTYSCRFQKIDTTSSNTADDDKVNYQYELDPISGEQVPIFEERAEVPASPVNRYQSAIARLQAGWKLLLRVATRFPVVNKAVQKVVTANWGVPNSLSGDTIFAAVSFTQSPKAIELGTEVEPTDARPGIDVTVNPTSSNPEGTAATLDDITAGLRAAAGLLPVDSRGATETTIQSEEATYTIFTKYNYQSTVWELDAIDSDGNTIVAGLAMVPGQDVFWSIPELRDTVGSLVPVNLSDDPVGPDSLGTTESSLVLLTFPPGVFGSYEALIRRSYTGYGWGLGLNGKSNYIIGTGFLVQPYDLINDLDREGYTVTQI